MLVPFCADPRQLLAGSQALEMRYPNSPQQTLLGSLAFVSLLFLFAVAAVPIALLGSAEL